MNLIQCLTYSGKFLNEVMLTYLTSKPNGRTLVNSIFFLENKFYTCVHWNSVLTYSIMAKIKGIEAFFVVVFLSLCCFLFWPGLFFSEAFLKQN